MNKAFVFYLSAPNSIPHTPFGPQSPNKSEAGPQSQEETLNTVRPPNQNQKVNSSQSQVKLLSMGMLST